MKKAILFDLDGTVLDTLDDLHDAGGLAVVGGGILGIEGAGIRILPTEYTTLFIILPFGGFLVMGVLIAAMQHISNKAADKKRKEARK